MSNPDKIRLSPYFAPEEVQPRKKDPTTKIAMGIMDLALTGSLFYSYYYPSALLSTGSTVSQSSVPVEGNSPSASQSFPSPAVNYSPDKITILGKKRSVPSSSVLCAPFQLQGTEIWSCKGEALVTSHDVRDLSEGDPGTVTELPKIGGDVIVSLRNGKELEIDRKYQIVVKVYEVK